MERVQRVGELFFCEAVARFAGCGFLDWVGWEADFGFVEGLDGGYGVCHFGGRETCDVWEELF
jgi:hypothetical protein